jgi:hypothetical protein
MVPALFPTFDAVRATLAARNAEPPFQPTRVFHVAAIVMQLDGIRREEWVDDVELSPKLFERFPRGEAPPPGMAGPQQSTESSYRVLDDTKPFRPGRCMTCVLKPGSSPCPTCEGTGKRTGDIEMACLACEGTGAITCPVCDGEQRTIACSVRYVNDRPVHVRQLFVPQVHGSLRPYLTAAIDPAVIWPKELAFDPAPSLVASAYRGASAVRSADEFQGWYFGAARDAALAARQALLSSEPSGLSRVEQRFFAIPVLWLIQEGQGIGVTDRHAAYFFDAVHELRTVTGHTST